VDCEVRREIIRLAKDGLTYEEIAARVARSRMSVWRVLFPLGGVYRPEQWWVPSPARLSLEERIEIRVGLELGVSFTVIATQLGRAPSTVSREVNANGGRARYRPIAAHRRAWAQARRPKPTKLAASPQLCTRVTADLEAWWSPKQIAQRLCAEFGDDTTMRISHETIYKSLYVQGRGELRRELARCLRTGRAQRRPRNRLERRGRIRDMVMISDRPAEVDDRAVPGHWEGDLIIGKDSQSQIGTLVERNTRFVILLHLPGRRDAATVADQMIAQMRRLPEHLRRSITWDQGKEMAEHARVKTELELRDGVFFCDPHSPWQRGTNENTNGLLRQYFPKGTDLSGYTQHYLDYVAVLLNGRPRQKLDWATPAEALERLLKSTPEDGVALTA
jgi:IS30 family transposase